MVAGCCLAHDRSQSGVCVCVSLTQINCDLYWSREAMKAICLCNYLSEGSLLLLEENTAYHHLIYKAQVLKCARVRSQTLCMTKGEMRVEAYYTQGIINSLFNERCRWVSCTWQVRKVRRCFCVLKLPDCSFVKSLHVGVRRGGGMCGAGACATVIVLSLNSCCHSYCDSA